MTAITPPSGVDRVQKAPLRAQQHAPNNAASPTMSSDTPATTSALTTITAEGVDQLQPPPRSAESKAATRRLAQRRLDGIAPSMADGGGRSSEIKVAHRPKISSPLRAGITA